MFCVRMIGHPARLCPSEGWVNDLEQDTPEGEDTNEEGCWTEDVEVMKTSEVSSLSFVAERRRFAMSFV